MEMLPFLGVENTHSCPPLLVQHWLWEPLVSVTGGFFWPAWWKEGLVEKPELAGWWNHAVGVWGVEEMENIPFWRKFWLLSDFPHSSRQVFMLEVCCLLCLVSSTSLFFSPSPYLILEQLFGHFALGSLKKAVESFVSMSNPGWLSSSWVDWDKASGESFSSSWTQLEEEGPMAEDSWSIITRKSQSFCFFPFFSLTLECFTKRFSQGWSIPVSHCWAYSPVLVISSQLFQLPLNIKYLCIQIIIMFLLFLFFQLPICLP